MLDFVTLSSPTQAFGSLERYTEAAGRAVRRVLQKRQPPFASGWAESAKAKRGDKHLVTLTPI